MTLGVSPERVREVRFAEQWRGYRTDEVDEFVEQVAEAFGQLEARQQESSDRAAEAERRLLDGGHDQDLSRTLILAQRTADAARQEAEADAARLVAEAEEQARLLMAEAEARRSRLDEEVEARMTSELGDLRERKSSLEREAASLSSFVEHERRRLADELRRQLAWLEQPGALEPLAPPREPGTFAAALGDIGGVVPHEPDKAPDEVGKLDEPMTGDDATYGDATTLDISADEEGGADEESGADGGVAAGRGMPGADQAEGQPPVDDDPFLAELRRAVDDPEPLGPRDDGPDAGDWGEQHDLYEAKTSPRFRRRRQR